ncbi:putative protein FAM157A [Gorilla gorilla gorilla]|uniref:putative protein FAM157A n=1 Tax=Gorilla gorilla gorilla TaxID=9595 RepID=UPI00300AF60E
MVPEAARGKVFQDSQEGAHIRQETVGHIRQETVCAEPWCHQRAGDPAPTNFPRRCQKQQGASTSPLQHEGRVTLVFFIGGTIQFQENKLNTPTDSTLCSYLPAASPGPELSPVSLYRPSS